jgi:predicted permease
MRERELSVRQAIGATRGRLVWYLLSDAILLAAVAGGLAAFFLYTAPLALFWLMLPALLPYVQEALRPTLSMVAFAIGLCVTTSLVLGLLPSIRFSRPALIAALKDDAGGGGRRVGRMHRFAAALQVGIAMPFLIISGTMVDWVRTTAATELGFTPEGLAAVELTVDRDGEANQGEFLLRRVRENLEQAHGIQRVTVADGLPLDFRSRGMRVSRPGRSDGATVRATRVGDGYLETLNIQLLRGRGIAADDGAGNQAVAVVSKPLADRLFGHEDPIGEPLALDVESGPRVVTIVGVTADFVGRSLDGSREQVLLPLAQHPASRVLLVARSEAGVEPTALTSAFQHAVHDADPDFTAASLMTGEDLRHRGTDDIIAPSVMVGGGGAAVLTLAALGIYGVIGFMVATRSREMAVRIALGASRRRIVGTIQSDIVRLVIPGVIGGLLLGIALARMVVPWRGLSGAAMEPVVYSIAAGVALSVALLAGLFPARRAASIEPMAAMRAE